MNSRIRLKTPPISLTILVSVFGCLIEAKNLRLRCAICEKSKTTTKHSKSFKANEKSTVTEVLKNHVYQTHKTQKVKDIDENGNSTTKIIDPNEPKVSEILTVIKKIEFCIENKIPIETIDEVIKWHMVVA